MSDDLLTKDFKPCAVYFRETDSTEMVLADVPTVWADVGKADLGYDMETGELVAIRVYGDKTKRPGLQKAEEK